MALGDLMESRFSQSQSSMVAAVSNHLDRYSISHHSNLNPNPNPNPSFVVVEDVVNRDRDSSSDSVAGVQRRENHSNRDVEDSETVASTSSYGVGNGNAVVTGIPATSMAYLPQNLVLSELRHEAFEACTPSGPAEIGLVSKWRPKDRMKTGCVALVLCLNISVDPPDVIKISPCARMECWIDPFSMAPQKALETIGKTLNFQYERWQPKAKYKYQLDPTVEEVKKLCTSCRKYAKSERVLFHYNGHGVPKPTTNGKIWFFNRSYTQYIPLAVSDLDSWVKTPSIYVFYCSATGMIVNAFIELQDWNPSSSSATSPRDCILLAACEAHETLPQSHEFPADVFTSCLTTPIKIALRWGSVANMVPSEREVSGRRYFVLANASSSGPASTKPLKMANMVPSGMRFESTASEFQTPETPVEKHEYQAEVCRYVLLQVTILTTIRKEKKNEVTADLRQGTTVCVH